MSLSMLLTMDVSCLCALSQLWKIKSWQWTETLHSRRTLVWLLDSLEDKTSAYQSAFDLQRFHFVQFTNYLFTHSVFLLLGFIWILVCFIFLCTGTTLCLTCLHKGVSVKLLLQTTWFRFSAAVLFNFSRFEGVLTCGWVKNLSFIDIFVFYLLKQLFMWVSDEFRFLFCNKEAGIYQVLLQLSN